MRTSLGLLVLSSASTTSLSGNNVPAASALTALCLDLAVRSYECKEGVADSFLAYWSGPHVEFGGDAHGNVVLSPVLAGDAELRELIELLALLDLTGVSGHGC